MKSLLIDLQYFPIVDYYLSLIKCSNIKFELYDRHRKMSFRNRCVIVGANGRIELSIPLVGGRDQRTISREVVIDNSSNWKDRHHRSIVSAYRSAPFFGFYEESLQTLFQRKEKFLVDWNLVCLEWLRAETRGNWNYVFTESFKKEDKSPEVTDLRDWYFPRWTAERSTADLSYRQVFQDRLGFVRDVSILDLLFCAGPGFMNAAAAEP
jgi:hypothetical protein